MFKWYRDLQLKKKYNNEFLARLVNTRMVHATSSISYDVTDSTGKEFTVTMSRDYGGGQTLRYVVSFIVPDGVVLYTVSIDASLEVWEATVQENVRHYPPPERKTQDELFNKFFKDAP